MDRDLMMKTERIRRHYVARPAPISSSSDLLDPGFRCARRLRVVDHLAPARHGQREDSNKASQQISKLSFPVFIMNSISRRQFFTA